ncbi:MAG: helix-turn-helix transcriptional regulator [Haloarcula sp.]
MRPIGDIRQMVRLVVASLLLVLVVGFSAMPPAMAQQSSESVGVQTPDRFDRTTFRVTVYENGSATWTIEYRTPLQNESEQEQFRSFADSFESSEMELYRGFVEQSTLLTQYGSNTTGREMAASGYDRSASVDPLQNTGIVTMSFRWSNFAIVSDGSVVVSDVFQGGFYIGPSQSLVFERGPGLVFSDAVPAPDSRSDPDTLRESESVTWTGERSFTDRRPYVEFEPRQTADTAVQSTQAEADPAEAGGGTSRLLPAAIVLLALLAGGAAAWRSGVAARVLGGSDGGAAAETGSVTNQPPVTTEDSTESASDSSDPNPSVADEELLSDSDRVLRLLEDNGGRMKQVDIVDSTDWSKSKVSMLLTDMEEEGDISKLRVGRENIISLAGEEPDAAGSPFDDE